MTQPSLTTLYPIDGDRLVRQFLDLVQIDSPTFAEAAFVRALVAELTALGLTADNDGTGHAGTGNVLAVLPGTDPLAAPLLIATHFDTVEPGRGIKPRVVDGVIESDGTTILGADNKSAVAAVLEAVRYLQAARPPHGDVELLFTWGEERAHLGARAFDVSRLRSRIGFAPDAGGPLGTIVTRAPYYTSIKAVFHGQAAHAGLEPEKGASAVAAAARAVAAMPLGRIDAATTANVGRMSGGVARNIVPEQAEIEGEVRSLDADSLARQVERMRAAVLAAAQETGVQVDLAINREYDGFTIGPDEAPLRIALAAMRSLGLTPHIASSGGGSDANELNAQGVRTVVLAMGGLDYHSTRERIAVADLLTLCQLTIALILEAGRQARGG